MLTILAEVPTSQNTDLGPAALHVLGAVLSICLWVGAGAFAIALVGGIGAIIARGLGFDPPIPFLKRRRDEQPAKGVHESLTVATMMKSLETSYQDSMRRTEVMCTDRITVAERNASERILAMEQLHSQHSLDMTSRLGALESTVAKLQEEAKARSAEHEKKLGECRNAAGVLLNEVTGLETKLNLIFRMAESSENGLMNAASVLHLLDVKPEDSVYGMELAKVTDKNARRFKQRN